MNYPMLERLRVKIESKLTPRGVCHNCDALRLILSETDCGRPPAAAMPDFWTDFTPLYKRYEQLVMEWAARLGVSDD